MFSRLFGKYLTEKEILTKDQLAMVMSQQNTARVKLGTIAVTSGFMTEEQADEVNYLQTQQDKRFGDIALEKGYLTMAQLSELLDQQGNAFMKFIQLLGESCDISLSAVEVYLADFQRSQGFSDEEMQALKKNDIDAIVPVFAFASKPFVTELTSLVLRNITRFITSDFYISTIRRVENYHYHCLCGQELVGENQIWMGFIGKENADAVLRLASAYAKEDFKELDGRAFDALGEFCNICSGLLATQLSGNGVYVDMLSPFAYVNQSMEGKGYVVPITIEGNELELFISVDEDILPGKEPYNMVVARKAGSQVTADSRGTLVVVDDSALIRKALRDIAESEGYTVVAEGTNGEEGIAAYQEFHPDLITLDITMPEMDGVSALEKIMEIDPNAKAVMITAAGQQYKVITALRAGAKKFIMKPLNRDEVIQTLSELIPRTRSFS